jgi:hypothetical protein
MFESDAPTLGFLACPRCGEVVEVDMSLDSEASARGKCSAGHDLLTFESDTLGLLVGASTG